jgi:hypothetical protein
MKLLDVKPLKAHVLELRFSDHTFRVFDGSSYLATQRGPLDYWRPCAAPRLTTSTRAPTRSGTA